MPSTPTSYSCRWCTHCFSALLPESKVIRFGGVPMCHHMCLMSCHRPSYVLDVMSSCTDVGKASLHSTLSTVAHQSQIARQHLRSATQQLTVVPWHRLSTVGRRAFTVHGPMVWNSLPDDLRAQQDYEASKPGFSLHTSVFSAWETLWQ